MRYIDLFESQETVNGTYMAASFDDPTMDAISEYSRVAGIPDPVTPSSLHCTIIYSRTIVDIQPNHDCSSALVKPRALELWPVSDGKHVLVITLDCPYLHSRFNEAIAMGATYDYDEYKPHITLSYDAGDFDVMNAPPLMFDMSIKCEYVEELVS